MEKIKIAIDGPAGAGKSTIAKVVAQRLGFVYIDTGAMYRAVGLYALKRGISPEDEKGLEEILDGLEIDIKFEEKGQLILLDGRDVTGQIRTQEISAAASDVAKWRAVRRKLVDLQRRLADKYSVVMDGRDIGTHVLPDAQVKLFLTADVEDRARRRYSELLEKGEEASLKVVLEDMKKRDYNDSHRTVAPLKRAEDAVEVNTTGFALEKSVELIYQTILDLLEQRKG